MVIKHPCSICEKSVAENHKAIKCDECQCWSHIKCNYVKLSEYEQKIGKNESWICLKCIPSVLPFTQVSTEHLKLSFQGKDSVVDGIDTGIPYGTELPDLNTILDDGINPNELNIPECKYFTPSELNCQNFKSCSFSVAHLNISSLNYHFDDLRNLLNMLEASFDVIGISESRLKTNKPPNNNIMLKDYLIVDCPTESNNGGALLYISKKLDFVERTDLKMYQAKDLESVFIEVESSGNKNCIIGCIYKHPNMPVKDFNENFLSELLKKLETENKDIILMGDFNINLLNYNKHEETNFFVDQLFSNSLLPSITKPTRVTTHSKTLIDNIFTNSTEHLLFSGNLTTFISDHLVQVAFFRSKAKQTYQIPSVRRNFNKFNREEFLLDFLETNWDEMVMREHDANKTLDTLIDKLNKLTNKHAPIKPLSRTKMKSKHSPWITNGIVISLKKRDKLYKKFINCKHPLEKANWHNQYKLYRNLLVSLCRTSKETYYQNFFEEQKHNHKKTWDGINSLINNKCSKATLPKTFRINNKPVSDLNIISNQFNDFYGSIAQKTKSAIPKTNRNFQDTLISPCMNSIFLAPTDHIEVSRLISKLNERKSNGPSSINVTILKLVSPTISHILASIFNTFISSGIFPQCLKKSTITPVFKKEDPNLVKNYRPISLLSNVGKILEKIIYSRVKLFLDNNEILFNNQFGFRNAHSTSHALIQITEKIKRCIDSGNYACGIFVDLQKAFDTVEHTILLKKLEFYGIRGLANDLLRSYLQDRSQQVQINRTLSKTIPISHGVPQGSVLGPLLFLIYINDLHKVISHSEVFHFADDTSLLYENSSLKKLNKNVNHDLSLLSHWLRANKISLNASKTDLIIFRSVKKTVIKKHLDFRISGEKIKPTTSTTYLGVILDQHLSYDKHISNLVPGLTRAVGLLSKIRHYVPQSTLRSIYFSLFHSKLIYGLQIWIHGNKELIKKVQTIQNKALRVISFKNYREHSSPLYKKLNILKLSDYVKLLNCLLIHDKFNNKLPDVFHDFVLPVNEIHSYNTRNSCKNVVIPQSNTFIYGSRSVTSSCTRDWNQLQKLINCDFLKLRRSQLKTVLTKHFNDT